MAAKKQSGGHGRGLCGAKKKQGPGTCTQVAGWGTPNTTGPCKLHGGSTRNHRKAAERELAQQAVERYGLPVSIDPGVALMQAVAASYGQVLYLRAAVAELGKPWLEDEHGSRPHSAWVMLKAEEKLHADVCRDALRAGVEQKAVELMEGEARRAVAIVEAFVAAMGWDRRDPKVIEAGLAALRVLPGGEAA